MLSDQELDEIFANAGYLKQGKYQYRAKFSNEEVHHFVEFQRSVKDAGYLPGRVRIGNIKVSEKSEWARSEYQFGKANKSVSPSETDRIGSIFHNMDRNHNYTLGGALVADNAAQVSSFLELVVSPLLRPIATLEDLYQVTLEGDDTPFRWSLSDPSGRAAQALILGKSFGVNFGEITERLDRRKEIIQSISNIKNVDNYFEFVWNY